MKRNVFIVVLVVVGLLVVGSMAAMAQDAPKEEPKIDINSASIDVIEELPGIGIKLAQAIIDGRPYEKVEDLLKVKGIGEKRFAKIKDLVEVKPIEEQKDEGQASGEEKKEEPKKEEPTK